MLRGEKVCGASGACIGSELMLFHDEGDGLDEKRQENGSELLAKISS